MALDRGPDESGSFRSIFEANMPSSRKPISHDSAAVLLLSYDSNDETYTDLDVQGEVRRMGVTRYMSRTDTLQRLMGLNVSFATNTALRLTKKS